MSKAPHAPCNPERYENATEGYIAYKSGYKYQLVLATFCATGIKIPARVETEFIIMEANGDLWLAQWYAYDGPSGPTLDTRKTLRLAAFHDAIYQLIRLGFLGRGFRKRADKLMYRIGREDKMWPVRIGYWLGGVRLFAKSAADAKNERKVLYAPAVP